MPITNRPYLKQPTAKQFTTKDGVHKAMRWFSLVLLILCGRAFADLAGQVVSVHDGNTITVLVNRAQVKVSLAEIDAPELRQPFGSPARQSLSDLCLGKDVKIDHISMDRYGRTAGHVVCNGVDANAAQVERGMAWVYRRDARSTTPLYLLEDAAQRSHEGLWADPSPVPPWEWRKLGTKARR